MKTLNQIRINAAKSDLKLARKEGQIAIVETKIGAIWVRYNNAGIYMLSNNGGELLTGRASVVIEFLKKQYQVVGA